jgi:protein-disulfide isomerase
MLRELIILGEGPNSHRLAELAMKAAHELDLEYRIEKTADEDEIVSHGVILTPALIIDGHVAFTGNLPSLDDLKKALR